MRKHKTKMKLIIEENPKEKQQSLKSTPDFFYF